MHYTSMRNRSREREMEAVASNRRRITAARLNGRDQMRMGLLTSAGLLIHKTVLSVRAINSAGEPTGWMQSPPTTPFIEPLFIHPIAQPVASLTPASSVAPNTASGERRARDHQALTQLPPQKFYEFHQRGALIGAHPEFPLPRLWTFNGAVPRQT
jgi:hypothetical protein